MAPTCLGLVLAFPVALLTGNLKVGQVFVVGNGFTRQDVILSQLPGGLSPGSPLRYSDLRDAERNLAKLGIFRVNSDTGVRPTVRLVNREKGGVYRDVLVQVEETPTWSVKRMGGVNLRGELVVSLVFEERNFDPNRFPTGRDDLLSGGAFRGAHQTFRLELIQIPLVPFGSPRFLQLGSLLAAAGDTMTPHPPKQTRHTGPTHP
jgi:outer membrane protein assembly factor BamA